METIEHLGSTVEPLLFFLGALFEEHLPQNVLFFLVRIIVFDVIIMRLIENTVRIMIAIWIFVSNSSSLGYARVGIDSQSSGSNCFT